MEQAQQPSSQPWQSETGEPGIVERKEKKRKEKKRLRLSASI